MKFFGARRSAPNYDLVATPVNALCGYCHEAIEAGDSGWVVPYSGKPCEPNELPFHHACWMRSIIGSVAHQQKRCSCFVPDSTAEDDPALTRRQAANASLAYYLEKNPA